MKGNFLKEKGLYLVLAGCVVAAGAASWAAIDGVRGRLENNPPVKEESTWQEEQPVENKLENVPEPSPAPSTGPSSSPPSSVPEDVSTEPAGPAEPPTPWFALPAEGKVMAVYSGDDLVYQGTLDDWRTHNGIDIAAAADSAVTAAAAGTVSAVYTDAVWGTVVEQTSGGLLLRYVGLAAEVAVEQGDTLALGQTIGRVGAIPCEGDMGPHLHFEVLENGLYKDPVALVG